MADLTDVADKPRRLGTSRAMEQREHYGEAMPTTEQRIAARLHEALDRQQRADIFTLTAERGLAAGGPEAPSILLTV
jgi:hypothetical protein